MRPAAIKPVPIKAPVSACVVEIGNQLTKDEKEAEADAWDVADGLLAGAIQFWLFSRQPCGDPRCEDCEPVSTAHGRMTALQQLVREFAEAGMSYGQKLVTVI